MGGIGGGRVSWRVREGATSSNGGAGQIVAFNESSKALANLAAASKDTTKPTSAAVIRRMPSKWPKPQWRAPWKLYRVIAGHLGWVSGKSLPPRAAVCLIRFSSLVGPGEVWLLDSATVRSRRTSLSMAVPLSRVRDE